MTSTTIKVSAQLRDRLKKSAAASGHTLGGHLEVMLEAEERRDRFRRLREQLAASPPDGDYVDELAEWQADSWT